MARIEGKFLNKMAATYDLAFFHRRYEEFHLLIYKTEFLEERVSTFRVEM
jgi:molybdate-binding protein